MTCFIQTQHCQNFRSHCLFDSPDESSIFCSHCLFDSPNESLNNQCNLITIGSRNYLGNVEPKHSATGCVDKYLCMCLIALFNRASTHILGALYSADIGIMNFGSPLDSVTCSWPADLPASEFTAFSHSSARRDL